MTSSPGRPWCASSTPPRHLGSARAPSARAPSGSPAEPRRPVPPAASRSDAGLLHRNQAVARGHGQLRVVALGPAGIALPELDQRAVEGVVVAQVLGDRDPVTGPCVGAG